jgi:Holliday junction DNA helicase RuvA
MANGAAAIRQAIRNSDVAFFQSVPRLGKKTAQKIIVDLQSKLGVEAELDLAPPGSLRHDLREALLGLGYDERSIQSVTRQVDESLPIEAAPKWALRELGAKR